MKIKLFGVALFFLVLGLGCISCEKDDDMAAEPMLIVKFKFDKNQQRLNNLGKASGVIFGNAAQTPDLHAVSAHYLEFLQNVNTKIGDGTVLYHGKETTVGGKNAIDFNQAKIVGEGETFVAIPLRLIAKGSYEWIRLAVGYQNSSIKVRNAGQDFMGTFTGFTGFNTYISSFDIDNAIFNINSNRSQGYWAFKLDDNPYSTEGQAPENATTAPNPIIKDLMPTDFGIMSGRFSNKLHITGNETKHVIVTLSLSVNKSFEWQEVVKDGKYEPAKGENIVDIGLRGLNATFESSCSID